MEHVVEKQEPPELTVILDQPEIGIYEGAAFDSYEQFNVVFKRWCAERNVRFSKVHSQTIEGANRWMKPGLVQYDARLQYKSVFLACVFADRKPRKGEPTETPNFRKRGATGCPACVHLNVKRDNMNQLVIRKLKANHNHPLIPFGEYVMSLEESPHPSMVHLDNPYHYNPSQSSFASIEPIPVPSPPSEETMGSDTSLGTPNFLGDLREENGLHVPPPVASFLGPPRLTSQQPRKRLAPTRPNSSAPKLIRRPSLDNGPMTSTPSITSTSHAAGGIIPESPQRFDQIPTLENTEGSIRLFELLDAQQNLDEEDLFCRSLALKLRSMEAETRSRLKIQIQTLVHNAQFSNAHLKMTGSEMGT